MYGRGARKRRGTPTSRMPRSLRPDFAGAVHHVWARGALKQTIFVDEQDHLTYIRLLERVVRWMSWQCLGWCLMGNHVHLLIETPQPTLWRGMQRLHGLYGYGFNRRHGGSGCVFGRRFDSNLIEDEYELWTVASYIANNPVTAGLCTLPQDWRWGSHRNVFEGSAAPGVDTTRLLSYFASFGGDPREGYIRFVAANARTHMKGLSRSAS